MNMLLLSVKNIYEHHHEIKTKEFTPFDFDLNPRNIWKLGELGLIELEENRKWQKYSIVDVFWLKLLGILQSYGLRAEVLMELKNHIKKKYGNKKSDGMASLFSMVAIVRSDIRITIKHTKSGFLVEIIEPLLNKVYESSAFQPCLTVPLLGIIRSIIRNPKKVDDEGYIMAMIRYGILTVPEVELLINNRQGLKSINVQNDDGVVTIDDITEDKYIDIILNSGYNSIMYRSITGQDAKFNFFQPKL